MIHILRPDSLAGGPLPFALLLHEFQIPVQSVVRYKGRGPDVEAVPVCVLRCRWVYVASTAERGKEHEEAAAA